MLHIIEYERLGEVRLAVLDRTVPCRHRGHRWHSRVQVTDIASPTRLSHVLLTLDILWRRGRRLVRAYN